MDSKPMESSYNFDEFEQDYHPQLVDATSAQSHASQLLL